MARRVFYSFHYQLDNWRVQKVRNIGAVEGQTLLTSNGWEDVAKGGESAIQKWIDDEMKGKSCNIVLIGSQTAGRKWVEYEFKKAWTDGKGVFGIHIHRLLDKDGRSSAKGKNPFSGFVINKTTPMDQVVKVYDPTGLTSADVYNHIRNNIETWTENAIAARQK